MIKTKEELLTDIKNILGDKVTSDEGITLLEDFDDSFNVDTSETEVEEWKKKYEENDKAWREKYTERFITGKDVSQNTNNYEPTYEATTYEELFKVKEN